MEKFLGLPILATEHGKHVDNLMIYVHVLMALLFVGWLAYFIFVLVKFRRGNNPKADYKGAQTHLSTYAEIAVAAVEGFLLIAVAVPFWSKLVDHFPNEKESVVIKVQAQQFAWNFRYAGPDAQFGKQDIKLISSLNSYGMIPDDPNGKDDIQTMNEMRVPVNKPVILHISSRDVIHSFKVAAFRLTQDAIPGMMIPTHFKATRPGKYQIICAQLCGTGHSGMAAGFVYVDSEEDYNKWVQSKVSGGGGSSVSEFE